MQQSNHERPAISPAGVVFEMTKHPSCFTATFFSDYQNGNYNCNHTSEGPEDSERLRIPRNISKLDQCWISGVKTYVNPW